MKTKLATAILILACTGVNAQWIQQNSNTTSDLTSIHGIGDTLLTVGSAVIRKTFDGGTTWQTVNGIGLTPSFTKMYDKNKIVIGGTDGKIARSLNGGTLWTTANAAGGSLVIGLYDVEFLNDSTYVAVGGSTSNFLNGGLMISKTTNSGTSWTVKVNNATAPTGLGIEAIQKHTIFLGNPLTLDILLECGGGQSINESSGDPIIAGNSWNNVMNNAIGNISFFDINFPNDSVGYIVGGKFISPTIGGVMFKTVDYGATWTSITTLPVTNTMYGVHFISADTGYVVGNGGYIFKTIDGGQNWISQTSGVTTELNKIYFTSSKIGYIAGEGGIILKTNNGGDLSTSIKENNQHNYVVLNNQENITIQTGFQMNNTDLIIFNSLGQQKEVKRNITGNSVSISTLDLTPGVYFFWLNNFTGKFIVNR